MLQTLQQMYAELPHPLLPNLIEIGMVCAAIVGIWEAWKARRHHGK